MRQHDPDWKKLIAALVVSSTALILAPCWALGYLTTKEVVFAASTVRKRRHGLRHQFGYALPSNAASCAANARLYAGRASARAT